MDFNTQQNFSMSMRRNLGHAMNKRKRINNGNYEIKILQLNSGGSYSTYQLLINTAIRQSIDIIIVQELPPKYEIKKGDGVRYYSSDDKRTAIIILNRTLVIEQIHMETNTRDKTACESCACVDIELTQSTTQRIIGVYSAPRNNLCQQLEKLSSFITDYTLLTGDFNARSARWNDKLTNTRGKILENFIDQQNLFIHYSLEYPTFHVIRANRVHTSNIDLTLCTPDLLYRLKDWELHPMEFGTEHRAISFKLTSVRKYKNNPNEENRLRWSLKDVSWDVFNIYFRDITQNLSTESSTPQEYSNAVDRCITEALIQAGGTSKGLSKPGEFPWMNEEILKNQKLLSRAKRRYKNCSPISNKHYLKWIQQLQRKLNQQIDESRLVYWRELFKNFDVDQTWSQYYKLLKARNRDNLTSKVIYENNTISGDTNLACFFARYFYGDMSASDSVLTPQVEPELTINEVVTQQVTLEAPVTLSEVEYCISTFGNNKAPGLDGIPPEVLKHMDLGSLKVITDFLNTLLSHGVFPKQYKKSIAVLIPKPGVDKTSPKSCRPIGLLPTIGKLAEKVILLKIATWLESILSNKQYGFRKSISTIDAIHKIISVVESNNRAMKSTLMISFDIEGAFDNIRWADILSELRQNKCNDLYVRIIESYLSDRSTTLYFNNATSTIVNTRGAVQGSCLGPTLWNIVMNAYLAKNNTDGVEVVTFADDITLLIPIGKDKNVNQNVVDVELRTLTQWALQFNLKFSTTKTKALWINKPKKNHEKPVITLNNSQIKYEQTVKILGVYFDTTWNFKHHANHIVDKLHKIYFAQRRVMGWPRPRSSLLRLIHDAVVKPKILYAMECIFPLMTQESIKKLESLHRRVLITFFGFYRTVPYSSALQALGMLPLQLEAELKMKIARALNNEVSLIDLPLDRKVEQKKSKKYYSRYPELVTTKGAKIRKQHQIKNDTFTAYTDGSKTENGVGYAFVIFSEVQSIISQSSLPLFGYATVFQAETLAMQALLSFVLKQWRKYRIHRLNVYTDSESLFTAIYSTYEENESILVIKNQLIALKQHIEIKINWIKAHADFTGNEYADTLAKTATNSRSRVSFDLVPRQTIKTELKRKVKDQQNLYFAMNSSKSILLPRITASWNKFPYKNNISTEFLQIMTGHGPYPSYLQRFKLKQNSTCICLHAPCDNAHLFYECRYTEKYARRLIDKIGSRDLWRDVICDANIAEILDELNLLSERITQLLKVHNYALS